MQPIEFAQTHTIPEETSSTPAATGRGASGTAAETHPELLPALRAATRDQHAAIERLLCLNQPMPRERYVAILQGFHDFLQPWERLMQDALPKRLQPWFAQRHRAGFVRHDLVFLGASLPKQERADTATRLPALDSLAACMGSLYVLEGSALGGQVVVPLLLRTLALRPGHGASYFHGFGERTGAMWREFRLLAQHEVGRDPLALDAARRSATETFNALIRGFGPLHERE